MVAKVRRQARIVIAVARHRPVAPRQISAAAALVVGEAEIGDTIVAPHMLQLAGDQIVIAQEITARRLQPGHPRLSTTSADRYSVLGNTG